MNLHSIASSAISRVNPFQKVVIRQSDGAMTMPSGRREPKYLPDIEMNGQVQALSHSDLRRIENLNVTDILKAIYLEGNFSSINRLRAKGGDLIIIKNETWLVTQVLEEWNDWCKLVITLQVDN